MNEKELQELIKEVQIAECKLWQASYFKYDYEMMKKRETYLETTNFDESNEMDLEDYRVFLVHKFSQRNSHYFFQD